MAMGDPYVGKYRFLDVQQGNREKERLLKGRRCIAIRERRYEDELDEAKEIRADVQREYEEIEAELEAKKEALEDAEQEVDRIKRRCEVCNRQIGEYSDAIQQAQLGLEAIQEIAHQSARGSKRPSGEVEASDPEPGPDRDTSPQNPPGVTPKSGMPLRREPMRIGPEEVQVALRRQVGDQEGEYRRYAREELHQHQRYPVGCTLIVDGVPYEMTEKVFLPLLLSAFGGWRVPHRRIIGCNVLRDVSQVGGTVTYTNRGQVIVRFANKEYMDEYCGLLQGCNLRCDITGRRRYLRTNAADRELEIRPHRHRRDILVSARFFEEIWDAHAVE